MIKAPILRLVGLRLGATIPMVVAVPTSLVPCAAVLRRAIYRYIPLRVHVPKWEVLWAQCTYIGSSLRPKYILFGYMDP